MTSHLSPQDTAYFNELQRLLRETNASDVHELTVNAPFTSPVHATSLDLGIVVLLLVNQSAGTIDRIALSDTPQAHGAVKMSEKPFKSIKIPVGYKGNIIAEAIASNKPHHTTDWQYLFIPAMHPQAARFNQAGAGIECSYVYPLTGTKDGGALIFSFYQPASNIGPRHKSFMAFYSQLVIDTLTKQMPSARA